MIQHPFGRTADGTDVQRVTLTGGGLTAKILNWGAVIQDLRLADHDAPLTLGFTEFDHYLNHSPYFGAIVGRFANRIANGRFEIDGEPHQTDTNFLEKHTLHGGRSGISQRIWAICSRNTNSVTLTLQDPDGVMGFPGTAELKCTYSLEDHGALRVELSATADQATLINLAHHSYFILDDSGDCRNHTLQVAAPHYLPVDGELIPTGEIANVAETPFDFLQPKRIGEETSDTVIYDHNFCVAHHRRERVPVAKVQSSKSGVSMEIVTTEPGLQFYAAHKLETPVPGLTGEPYGPFAGMALETQLWPDAPNHPHFPKAILRPGETSVQITEYRFSKA